MIVRSVNMMTGASVLELVVQLVKDIVIDITKMLTEQPNAIGNYLKRKHA